MLLAGSWAATRDERWRRGQFTSEEQARDFYGDIPIPDRMKAFVLRRRGSYEVWAMDRTP